MGAFLLLVRNRVEGPLDLTGAVVEDRTSNLTGENEALPFIFPP